MAKSRKSAFVSTPPRTDPRPFRRARAKPRFSGKRKLSEIIRDKFNKMTLKNHLTDMAKRRQTHREETHRIENDSSFKPLYPYYRFLLEQGDMSSVEESDNYEVPARIGGQEFGSIIKRFFKYTEGLREDSQMKLAKSLYKVQNIPCFDSQSASSMGKLSSPGTDKWLNIMFSTSGVNRRGVYAPLKQFQDDVLYSGDRALARQQFVSPLLGKLSLWHSMRYSLMANPLRTWLTNSDDMAGDIFFAVTGITDIVTISNLMKYSPIDLKIYIVRCKQRCRLSPQACWFKPTTGQEQMLPQEYVYTPTSETLKWPGDTPADAGEIYSETSVHLAATPRMSPTFDNFWEIVQVQNQTIEPSDKFEMHVQREFRRAMSARQLEEAYQAYLSVDSSTAMPNTNIGYYQESDLALLITYRGLPGIMKSTSSTGEEVLREVDATPAKINVQSRSSYQIAANDVIKNDSGAAGYIDELSSAAISGTARILDQRIETSSFSDSTWVIDITTPAENKEGGSR